MDNDLNIPVILLILSIIIQLIASIAAMRLIRHTRRKLPWLAISVAISLMAVRRIITLSQYISGDGSTPDLSAESVALVISILMMSGVLMIAPALRAEKKAAEGIQQKLQAAVESAENANRAKSEFLANMSHDLRTPLNAIIGFSEIMTSQILGPPGNQKYSEYAADIHQSSFYLLQLVNDILDLSTLEAGEHTLKKEHVDILEVSMECHSLMKNMITEKGLNCVMNVAADLPPLYADRQSIKQILMNLASNAIKFTPERGDITLNASIVDGFHVIELKDTGIGIPEDNIATITKPFSRAENNAEKAHEGTGLGLAIVSSLIALHEGTLDVASRVGEGTIITISIPSFRV